ncbi:HAD-IA family hydrolase [Sphingomonas sp. S1-29]|uniref:HAD-IA family hydrolase n=1 Tax=Sphingomonas sp. S1-29 TaxID=2991074 RepID=UPI00223E9137|nr:HAD-IA family hydrolase [Sphingomonas sp. S1-29]UZK69478.1 HAD-IA family hydrolase [Sphingomonas sp. S1-29]
MTGFPFDIVGFDLDGTLLDTSGDLAAAVNHVLALNDRAPLAVEAVKPMVGLGARHMLKQGLAASGGFDEAMLDIGYPLLLEHYAANISAHTVPFPGLLDTLDVLQASGVTLAIVTNKFEHMAVKLIGELGLSERFACIIGGDTMGKGNAKPSPLPIHEMIRRTGGGRAAFVGDSIFDIDAAKAAGIPSIAVSFGFLWQPVEELEADAVIDHFDELVSALHRLA